MTQYQIYFLILLAVFIAMRVLNTRLFYKLSDEDKLKTLAIGRKSSKVSMIVYLGLLALYLVAIYVVKADTILSTKILMVAVLGYIVAISPVLYRRVMKAGIVIPYYRVLIISRVVAYTLLCMVMWMWLSEVRSGTNNQQSWEYLQEAEKKWKIKDYRAAIEFCDKAIKEDSAWSAGYINRGIYRYDAGDYTGAHTDWRHALHMGDTTAAGYIRNYPEHP